MAAREIVRAETADVANDFDCVVHVGPPGVPFVGKV